MELLVTKSNTIIEASYRLTLQEQRLVLFCVAQVDSRRPLDQQRSFVVEAGPFRETFGLAQEKVYEEMKDAAKRLFERKVTIVDAQNGQVTLLRWVSMIRYENRKGRVVLNFAPELLPFISDLKDCFTSYPLEAVAKLTSTFAVRLFELLAQYARLGRRQMSVEQLRRWLDSVDSYPRFSEFERWVIEPAVQQLNECTTMQVTWAKRRVGRRVTHLEFRFAQQRRRSMAAPGAMPASTVTPSPTAETHQRELDEHIRRLGRDPVTLVSESLQYLPPQLRNRLLT